MKWPLEILSQKSGLSESCLVSTNLAYGRCIIDLEFSSGEVLQHGGPDFEDALVSLRIELESGSQLLLCNRFRRNAFVTSLSRQMSQGLQCYLVKPRRAVKAKGLVACLDPAPKLDVVSASEAALYIENWKSKPPPMFRFMPDLRRG